MKVKRRQADTQDLLPQSPTERVQVRLQIHLHPSKLLSVDLGVLEHINSLLLRYAGIRRPRDLQLIALS